MTRADVRRLIELQTESLGPVLHTAMATSLTEARRRLMGHDLMEQPHLLSLLTRAEIRKFLEGEGLLNGWRVGGNPKLMGQLVLENPGLDMSMRMLKGHFRLGGAGVPTAGTNRARRALWTGGLFDRELDLGVPTIAETKVEAGALGPINLLWLWDHDDVDEFQMRVAHPIEPGVYGREVECDLLLDVKAGGEIFKRLEFLGSQEHDDLVGLIELDEVEDESGA